MRFEKPKKKSGRPDFVAGRIAVLVQSDVCLKSFRFTVRLFELIGS